MSRFFKQTHERLLDACAAGSLDVVEEILRNTHTARGHATPTCDINTQRHGASALHLACRLGRGQIVSRLLRHPGVEVNLAAADSAVVNERGRTPLHEAVAMSPNSEPLLLLLNDSRTDVNAVDCQNRTALFLAVQRKQHPMVRCLVAFRGETLKLTNKVSMPVPNYDGPRRLVTSAILAFQSDMIVTWQLLFDLEKSRSETIFKTRHELGVTASFVASFFAYIVMTCDDYLRLKARPWGIECEPATLCRERFIRVAKRLPIELQMVLCHRAHHSPGAIVLTKHSEPVFQAIYQMIA